MTQQHAVAGSRRVWRLIATGLCVAIGISFYVTANAVSAHASGKAHVTSAGLYVPGKRGMLDCNGKSPVQRPWKIGAICTDIRGRLNVKTANNYDDRFWDNGEYIGHDEPDLTYHSSLPGSGANVTWTETIGKDPSAAPTVSHPGRDVTHYVELTPAPWTSMMMCDSDSYPQLPCTPTSDSNAPSCSGLKCSSNSYPGGGSAFMEFQLYPPGIPPFADSVSCNDTQWCAALTIDSLECTAGGSCNNNCVEPVNFAFVQTNGVPAGPPSPQLSDLSSATANRDTLLMNPGDKIWIHMWDAPVPGERGAKAFEVELKDLTTKKTGWMQASAANGFAQTSIANCDGTPFNFQPEYSTAGTAEVSPWAALQTNISTEFETGHFEPCTSVTNPQLVPVDGVQDKIWFGCTGPYESASDKGSPETSDAACYPKGDRHYFFYSKPDIVAGCQDNLIQNGDVDFDGTPYYADWPTGTTPGKWPGSFVESEPTTNGKAYASFFIQTDLALSELNSGCGPTKPSGCVVPPSGPGHFYPYWSESDQHGTCMWEFGNVSGSSTINDFGKDKEYGTNKLSTLGYPEFVGKTYSTACPTGSQTRRS